MKKVLVLVSSVREGRASAALASTVIDEIKNRKELVGEIVDLKDLQLPFYDAELLPSAEGFVSEHENIRQWQRLVKESDGLVMLTPEYNAGMAATQKNAIDWLFNEWTDKPVAFVAYGWYAGAHTLAQLQEISTVIKWKPVEKSAGLQFTKDIELDGSSIDGGLATQIVGETLDLLV